MVMTSVARTGSGQEVCDTAFILLPCPYSIDAEKMLSITIAVMLAF